MLRYRTLLLILGVILIAAAAGIIIAKLDRPVMEAIYFRPPALLSVMRIFTLYGSWAVLLPAGIIGILYGYYHLRGDLSLRLGIGMVVAAGVVEGLKPLIARARPGFLHYTSSSGASFPSGHSLEGVVVWGMLAAMISTLSPTARNWARILYIIPVLSGWSRMFLGVHWPSDILASWGIGLLIVAALGGPRRDSVSQT